MFFAIDIDRTLAIDRCAIATAVSRTLGLSLSDEVLIQLEDYWAFTRLPEVVAYLATAEHHASFQVAYQQAKQSLDVLAALNPIPGAAEGVCFLQQQGNAAYYTSRTESMLETTSAWLSQHSFPHLEVVSCYNFYIKYLKTFIQTRHTNEHVVLIDDNAQKIVEAWPRTIEKWPIIGEQYPTRFTLVAYGFTKDSLFSQDVPFPVLPLPSWESEQIQKLLDCIVVTAK